MAFWILLALAPEGLMAASPAGTVTGQVSWAESLLPLLQSRGFASLYRQATSPASNPLEDVVVYLEKVDVNFPVPSRNAVSRHRGWRFEPRVLPVLVGQRLVITNEDSYDHPLASDSRRNKPFRRILKAGSVPLIYRPSYHEIFTVTCEGHLRSELHVLALQNPYYAQPGKDGSFILSDVPPGQYTLVAWHPDLAPVTAQVSVLARRDSSVVLHFEKGRNYP